MRGMCDGSELAEEIEHEIVVNGRRYVPRNIRFIYHIPQDFLVMTIIIITTKCDERQ